MGYYNVDEFYEYLESIGIDDPEDLKDLTQDEVDRIESNFERAYGYNDAYLYD